LNRSRSNKAAVGIFSCCSPDTAVCPARRYCILLALCLFLSTAAIGQSVIGISGTVTDSLDGQPLEHVRVEIEGTDFVDVTDAAGYFELAHIPAGIYRVRAVAEGYRSYRSGDIEVLADISRQCDIRLQRHLYLLQPSIVSTAPPYDPAADIAVVDRDEIVACGADEIVDVLRDIEGVYVQESGDGGPVRVSIRGCDPKHVLVLVDGQRINPSGSGETDLSTVPLEMVEKIEVYRGGQSARFGADALGGAINIVTHVDRRDAEREITAVEQQGAWKASTSKLMASDPVAIGRLHYRLAFGHERGNGDFPYDYSVSPKPNIEKTYAGRRLNADFERRNYFASGQMVPQGAYRLDFSLQVYNAEDGLPGSATDIDTSAYKTDGRRLFTLHLANGKQARHGLHLRAGYSRFIQHFVNRDDYYDAYRYDSHYTNDVYTLDATHSFSWWRGSFIEQGVSVQRDVLFHDDFLRPGASQGRSARDNIGSFVSGRQTITMPGGLAVRKLVLTAAIRFDNTETSKDATRESDTAFAISSSQWSHTLGGAVTLGDAPRVVVRGSYGHSYRLPAINALFWKGDVRSGGNAHLRPEKAEHSDAGFDISWERSWLSAAAGVTYYHSYIRDLIVWQPGYQDVWRPVNLDASKITGHEDYIRLGVFDELLSLDYRNTITVAKNNSPGINENGRYLTYRPHFVTVITARLNWWKLMAEYGTRMVDIRFANDANTKFYDAYRVDDVRAGFKTGLSRIQLDMQCRVNNLYNEHYVMIAHYPMPGRQWEASVRATYSLD